LIDKIFFINQKNIIKKIHLSVLSKTFVFLLMKKLAIVIIVLSAIVNAGCYKKPEYKSDVFKASIVDVEGVKTISWSNLNIAGLKGIEIQVCKNEKFTDSVLTQQVAIFPNNDLGTFELPNIVLDTILKSNTVFFKVNMVLEGRKIGSNILSSNGNALLKLDVFNIFSIFEQQNIALVANVFVGISLYNYVKNINIPLPLTFSDLNNVAISFSMWQDSIPVMILQDKLVRIYDVKTGILLKSYTNNTYDRCFNNGATITGNQLISQYSKNGSNILNVSKYDLSTDVWLDSIDLKESNVAFNILLSNDRKSIFTRSSNNIYKVNIDGPLQILKSFPIQNSFNREMVITKSDKILINNNNFIFELDKDLLQTSFTLPQTFPSNSSPVLSDKENYYTTINFDQSNQGAFITNINIYNQADNSEFKQFKYNDEGIDFFRVNILILESSQKILFIKSTGSNTYFTEKLF
jgi:hypothetical protein